MDNPHDYHGNKAKGLVKNFRVYEDEGVRLLVEDRNHEIAIAYIAKENTSDIAQKHGVTTSNLYSITSGNYGISNKHAGGKRKCTYNEETRKHVNSLIIYIYNRDHENDETVNFAVIGKKAGVSEKIAKEVLTKYDVVKYEQVKVKMKRKYKKRQTEADMINSILFLIPDDTRVTMEQKLKDEISRLEDSLHAIDKEVDYFYSAINKLKETKKEVLDKIKEKTKLMSVVSSNDEE